MCMGSLDSRSVYVRRHRCEGPAIIDSHASGCRNEQRAPHRQRLLPSAMHQQQAADSNSGTNAECNVCLARSAPPRVCGSVMSMLSRYHQTQCACGMGTRPLQQSFRSCTNQLGTILCLAFGSKVELARSAVARSPEVANSIIHTSACTCAFCHCMR